MATGSLGPALRVSRVTPLPAQPPVCSRWKTLNRGLQEGGPRATRGQHPLSRGLSGGEPRPRPHSPVARDLGAPGGVGESLPGPPQTPPLPLQTQGLAPRD